SVTTVPAGGAWLTYLPTGATVNPGQPLKMVVQANLTNLAAGAPQAMISFQFSDGSIRSVNILNLVAPSGGNAARTKSGERLAGACSPQGLSIQPAAPADQFSAALLQ